MAELVLGVWDLDVEGMILLVLVLRSRAYESFLDVDAPSRLALSRCPYSYLVFNAASDRPIPECELVIIDSVRPRHTCAALRPTNRGPMCSRSVVERLVHRAHQLGVPCRISKPAPLPLHLL